MSSGLTNNEIVSYVCQNINVDAFINKVIENGNYEDLRQYIYLHLLEYNNNKLNDIFNQKVLPQFIMKIILNQRNYYRSYYNLYLKFNDIELTDIEDEVEPTDNEDNRRLIFINREIKKFVGHRKNLTDEEEYEMLQYEVYRMYLMRSYSMHEMARRLDLSYATIFRLIKSAKETIKKNYIKKYGNTNSDLDNSNGR